MTTDIARMDTNAIAVLGNANNALDRLGAWVTAASQAHQLVTGLIHTAFIPDSYRVKVDPRATPEERAAAERVAVGNATAAILQGITLGIDPLTALQQIYIVHGRPGMYARLMVALLIAHGHDIWTEDLTDTRAALCGRRRGSEAVERVIITMDMARKAGWTTNQAYTKTPQDMLYARAATRVCNKVAPEVLMGIASVEEIQDEIHATAEVGPARTVRAPARARPSAVEAAVVEEPPLDEPSADVAAPAAAEPAQRLVTAAQQRKMHALLNESGRSDRDLGIVFVSGIIGREVSTSKELTVEEAGQVIAALEADAAAGTDEPPLDAS